MGSVDEGIIRTDIRDEFKLCNVYAKERCRDCFARFYCSGGCAANSYHFHGSITDAYEIGCEMQKKRISISRMIPVPKRSSHIAVACLKFSLNERK